ncbi:conserved hypothetical protein [Pediculus humanus corporis]|uniref:Protein tipE n=1 Tax=Pediculus humanus subsp. corporis TaxID=121224 RepID=E0VWK1_PEDHC|nr:uncharacterized protein Phum_PHUM488060 [Pediculus humanus corporis]EEB17757.1 conserved hypothetical protein [Pediculus humanus corporis]
MEAEDQCDAANVVGCEGKVETPVIPVQTLLEKAKFYVSLCMGTTAIISVFAFLFLIPFVVDPAISTIIADYEQEPVICKVIEHVYSEGLRNCTWASCREGCTTAVLKCHQITVSYSKNSYNDFLKDQDLTSMNWDVNETKFFINTEGCGYPPKINCSEFASQYGNKNVGKIFPCYYSKTYPEIVVAHYSWDDNLRHLILALVVPTTCFIVAITILTYWYCPGCQKGCSKRRLRDKYPSKEELKNEEYDEEEEEEEEEDEDDEDDEADLRARGVGGVGGGY